MRDFQIIPKQEAIPAFDPQITAVKHIEYYPFGAVYEEDEITQPVISQILKDIATGDNIYFFLDPYGEENFLEVISDGEWLSIGYCFDIDETGEQDIYYSYNPDFADILRNYSDFSDKESFAPIVSGGQSPIKKCFAVKDTEAVLKAVEYFIHTGKRYPGIDWAKQLS